MPDGLQMQFVKNKKMTTHCHVGLSILSEKQQLGNGGAGASHGRNVGSARHLAWAAGRHPEGREAASWQTWHRGLAFG